MEKTLNKQIAEALYGELHYVEEDGDTFGDTFIYRVGVDDLDGAAYDVLEDYEHSLDAVFEALPDDILFEVGGNLAEGYNARMWTVKTGRITNWYGGGATRQEATANALLAWATRVKSKA